MANTSTILVIDQVDPLDVQARTGKVLLRGIINKLEGYLGGSKRAASIQVFPDGTVPAAATGTLTIASGSGAVGGTINGVTITDTWATSDTVAAGLVATAINASTNALVQFLVTATSAAGVVTITAAQKGRTGNTITLAASGTGVTASGARLTAGTGGNVAATTITL